MNTLGLVLQLVVAAGALAAAVGLFFRVAWIAPILAWNPGATLLRRALGALWLVGGALMLVSAAQPFFAFFAAVLLALILVASLAAGANYPADRRLAFTNGMLVATFAVVALRPLGLRVLSLPRADALPYEPVVAARVLKTYPEGTRFESVRVSPEGTIYMTANRGEDWSTGDKSRVVAQVVARTTSGDERVFFELPAATTAGVLAFGPDGALYLTSDGAARGVWRLDGDGRGEMVARFPEGSWPNGICAGPDGKLYVADARRGAVWRVDPQAGSIEVVRDDDELKARGFVSLAPAANGLHFVGRDLFVTVSDKARVLKFRLGADGTLGAPALHATGIPGDDFAVDGEGAIYVTTHPYDTLVRVTPDGHRAVVADARQHVIGATDAAFGVLPGDTRTIYLVTDGGAFSSGNPRAAGTLIALTLPPTSQGAVAR